MKTFDTVAIVGVGLIGASIGLAVRQRRVARRVVGVGRGSASLEIARARQAVDRTTTDLRQGVQDAQLIVVCTPVRTIAPLVATAAAARPEALITDAGSTKVEIVSQLDDARVTGSDGAAIPVRFVGSHPLAGDHRTGPRHARGDLLEGRTVVITPSARSRQEDVELLEQFWTALGARTVTMDAQLHDRLLAASSHLPHLLASALAAATPEDALSLVATGWLDTTRIAAGDPRLWRDILSSNRGAILRALDRFEHRLEAFREALAADQPDRLIELLNEGKQTRDAMGN